MFSFYVLVLLSMCSFAVLLLLFNYSSHGNDVPAQHLLFTSDSRIQSLVNLVNQQNATIHKLTESIREQRMGMGMSMMESTHSSSSSSSSSSSISTSNAKLIIEQKKLLDLKDKELSAMRTDLAQALSQQQQQQQQQLKGNSASSGSSSSSSCSGGDSGCFVNRAVDVSLVETKCEEQFGMSLPANWASHGQEWCSPPSSSSTSSTSTASRIKCYPYTQAHKQSPDIFCEGHNLVIDFSKIHGAPQLKKDKAVQNYLDIAPGAFSASCRKTGAYQERLLMNHQKGAFRSFKFDQPETTTTSMDYIEHTTYLLQRDEDCENAFHSTADFMNMFLVMAALGIHATEQQVMLFDRHIDGPFLDLIQRAYSPNHPVI